MLLFTHDTTTQPDLKVTLSTQMVLDGHVRYKGTILGIPPSEYHVHEFISSIAPGHAGIP